MWGEKVRKSVFLHKFKGKKVSYYSKDLYFCIQNY